MYRPFLSGRISLTLKTEAKLKNREAKFGEASKCMESKKVTEAIVRLGCRPEASEIIA